MNFNGQDRLIAGALPARHYRDADFRRYARFDVVFDSRPGASPTGFRWRYDADPSPSSSNRLLGFARQFGIEKLEMPGRPLSEISHLVNLHANPA